MNFVVVIPARFASTRLPGKALADLAGKPMVVRVADQARESGASEVIIATDHPDIAAAAKQHGYAAVMTRADHATGTDRIAEVATRRDWGDDQIVVNVQGDEPRIAPELIRDTAAQLQTHPTASVSTACHPIQQASHLTNPNIVKVALDRNGLALYFSRAPIPWARDAFASDPARLPDGLPVYRHVGIYAYRCSFLKAYPTLSAPAIEQFEALEQLRALWHGYRIAVAVSNQPAAADVNTAEDLEAMQRTYAGL